jgi:hypothetical protein
MKGPNPTEPTLLVYHFIGLRHDNIINVYQLLPIHKSAQETLILFHLDKLTWLFLYC